MFVPVALLPFLASATAQLLPLSPPLARRKEDLSFCYGDDSICSINLELRDRCRGLDFNLDDDPWYRCICANGGIAADEACYWCETIYDIGSSDMRDLYTEGCSSVSVSIAPVPSSMLLRQSRFNATYTGVIRGTATTSDASSPDASSTETTTTSLAPSTYFGGTTHATTIGGGGEPTGLSIATAADGPAATATAATAATTAGAPGRAASWEALWLACALAVAANGLH